MKIQELADKTGLTVHAIRFYEKEGLLNERHVQREGNNYRRYTEEALERLRLIKKFQSIGCSLAELKDVLRDHDEQTRTDEEVIDWIRHKIGEVECQREEIDKMLDTLHKMLAYRLALRDDPAQAQAFMAAWQASRPW